MGADIALFKHLPYLMLKKQRIVHEQQQLQNAQSSSWSTAKEEEYISIVEEISNTFTALEMVLRCSAESISTCFARIGSELFPILIDFIQDLSLELSQGTSGIGTETPTNMNMNNMDMSRSPTTVAAVAEDDPTENRSSVASKNSSGKQDDDPEEPQHDISNQRELDRASKSSTPTPSYDGSATSVKRLESEGATASTKNEEEVSSNSQIASKVTLKTCTKIIGHFARVGSLTETLATTPLLLDTLCDVMSNSHLNDNIPIEARLNCLWIIANLACSADNMILISQHPKIQDTLFEILSHPTIDEENDCEDVEKFVRLLRTRAVAVRATLNLSWAQENKIPFAENIDLVEDLLRIASHRKSKWGGSGRGVSGILLQARRHACGTLRNLAAAPRKYKRRLCRFKSGEFLDVLADIARNDHDSEVRDKIHATLFNLVSADTAKLFTEKRGVLDTIIAAASSVEEKDETGGNTKASSRKMAEDTLRSLEKALPEDDEGYDILRPTLSKIDSQIAINRTNSNLGSMTISITNFSTLPSISNFSFGDMSHTNLSLNPGAI